MKRVALAVALLFFAAEARAQSASIRGIVRDSAARPVPNAEVSIDPLGRRARTDSAGRFLFDTLDPGQYTLRARRLGYAPAEWSIDLSKNGRLDVPLVLGARIALLDTVFVADGRPCDAQSYEGFLCRRATAKGRFIDFPDIDTMDVLYSAELLRDVNGFTVATRSTRIGPTRVVSPKRCTIVLVNGVPESFPTVPESPFDIIGIEIYQNAKEIPAEYHRYTWGKESCWLVAYWTANYLRPIARPSLPRP